MGISSHRSWRVENGGQGHYLKVLDFSPGTRKLCQPSQFHIPSTEVMDRLG